MCIWCRKMELIMLLIIIISHTCASSFTLNDYTGVFYSQCVISLSWCLKRKGNLNEVIECNQYNSSLRAIDLHALDL